MSRRNSQEEKAKRRAVNTIRKENSTSDARQIWTKTKDKYGKEVPVPVMMPTRRQGIKNRRARS